MERPLQIYYNLSNGQVIQEVDGDIIEGDFHETTEEEAFTCFLNLVEVNKETLGKIILPYSDIDFEKKLAYYYHINVNTKTIIWDSLI
jgi:hypothetical protein